MLGYLLNFKKITPFLTSIFGINEFVFLCWLLEEGLGKMSSNENGSGRWCCDAVQNLFYSFVGPLDFKSSCSTRVPGRLK